jgi:hypothetical protein
MVSRSSVAGEGEGVAGLEVKLFQREEEKLCFLL